MNSTFTSVSLQAFPQSVRPLNVGRKKQRNTENRISCISWSCYELFADLQMDIFNRARPVWKCQRFRRNITITPPPPFPLSHVCINHTIFLLEHIIPEQLIWTEYTKLFYIWLLPSHPLSSLLSPNLKSCLNWRYHVFVKPDLYREKVERITTETQIGKLSFLIHDQSNRRPSDTWDTKLETKTSSHLSESNDKIYLTGNQSSEKFVNNIKPLPYGGNHKQNLLWNALKNEK